MRQRLKVSRSGVELVKSFEGLRQNAALLPDGRWTVGYGHTFSAREGAKTTPEDAEALLRFDLLPVVDAVNNLVVVPLNQNQFDALVSFCFNIGVENFAQSTVVKRINEGRFNEAAVAMDSWRSAEYNGQTYVLAPLIRRRAAEKSLFLTPDEVTVSSPTMVVRPIEEDRDLPVVEDIHSLAPVTHAAPVEAPVVHPEPVVEPIPVAPAFVAEPAKPVIVRVAEVAPSLPEPTVVDIPVVDAPVVVAPVVVPQVLEAAASAPAFSISAEPQDEIESHMSPAVLAALKLAQDEQRIKNEEQAKIAESLAREQMLRAELEKLEKERLAREGADLAHQEALRAERERAEMEQRAAEAARAEQARLELARLELARQEQLRLEQAQREAAAAEAARLEAQRLEAERQEMLRLEAEKLEAERLEAAKLEAQRLEAQRLQEETLERERQEAARLEAMKLEQERLAREAAEKEAAERQAALAAASPALDEAAEAARKAEEQRKAEAAAALMRFYSPYGASAPAPKPIETPTPSAPPVQEAAPSTHSGGLKSPFELSAQSEPEVQTPAPAVEAVRSSQPELPLEVRSPVYVAPQMPVQPQVQAPVQRQAEPEPEPAYVPNPYVPEPEIDYTPSMGSPSKLEPPVITALNPYRMSPEVAKKVEEGLHWRDRLNRPVPSQVSQPATVGVRPEAAIAAARPVVMPEATQPNFPNLRPAGAAAHAFGDDEALLDHEQDLIAHDSIIVEDTSWWRMLINTIKWVVVSGLSVAFIGGAVALSIKSGDASVAGNGALVEDFKRGSIILAGAGIILVGLSIWSMIRTLKRIRNA